MTVGHHRRRRARRVRGGASRSRRAAFASTSLEQKPRQPHARADQRQAVRARVLELVPRRGARQRGRPAQGRDAARSARSSCRRPIARACRRAARSPWIASCFSAQMSGLGAREPAASSVRPGRRRARSRSERPVIIATGPLTGDAPGAGHRGARRRQGRSPTTTRSRRSSAPTRSTRTRCSRASRWDKGEDEADQQRVPRTARSTRPSTRRSSKRCAAREKVEPKAFEEVRYFEGCLPIEVMAERGEQTLAFGPMKPVGLTDPRTGRWPLAVVQLRQEDEAGDRVQPGRLPDAHDLAASRSASCARSRASRTRSSSGSARCTGTRS